MFKAPYIAESLNILSHIYVHTSCMDIGVWSVISTCGRLSKVKVT